LQNSVSISSQSINDETRKKNIAYNWDREMQIVRQMQQCQRNWDYTKSISKIVIDHLLWHAENAPSKQHEAYYDVYWTADRGVIEEISKYTWGSTHSRNPPSTWRNTQANANLYILFVAKEPETQLNCHADGTTKSNKDSARWENAYVSIGIAMGLVMRAAQSLGLSTGCNKSHGDLNGNDFWEKRLGILDDVATGRKKIAYGIGIGYPQHGRPRWETDDYELCIGAGNGSNLTTLSEDDPNWRPYHPRTGKEFRKTKIIDIRTTNTATDPYGNVHTIPTESSIKINTIRKRLINITEIK
jgi:nitroreductase